MPPSRAILDGIEPLSPAERQRRYRASKSARGEKAARGKRLSQFDAGEFVAVDGEGFSEGDEIITHAATSGAEYRGKQHYYALLSASDGSELYSGGEKTRLSAEQCLNFLIDIKLNNKRAILVCFGGSYDVSQMLAYDLTKSQIKELMINKGLGGRSYTDVSFGLFDYRLEFKSRKSFTIWRWQRGANKYYTNDKGKRQMTECDTVTLWDVWGFFQDSFAGVLKKWVPQHEDYQFIKRMKGERSIFARSEIEEIKEYNRAELRCLVTVMDMVRNAVERLGLTLTRWDGAGAIASAMCRVNKVRDHMQPASKAVFDAARSAYSGGHIEVCKIGAHTGDVHHYDINSAYPHHFRRLPSMAGGLWSHVKRGVKRGRNSPDIDAPPPGFSIVKLEYQFHDGMPFYPLFFREPNGRIIYPPRGTGWYWFDEYAAAKVFGEKFGAIQFRVLEYHTMIPADRTARPFAWIEDYFERRKQLVEESRRSGIPSGEEKILKLGYNACYGKTCQQVGARLQDGELKLPSYFQIEWSGFVTAGCRAQLMMAAIQKPNSIISFATDGIFATEPLDLDCPTQKILGAWEYQLHVGITMVMPGVYWLHEHDGSNILHSRGFDKAQMAGSEVVLKAWRARKSRLSVKLTRLIGLGSALTGDMFWSMRGQFVTARRELAINGDNSKRYPVMLYRENPFEKLVNTQPRDHFDDLLTPLEEIVSKPYDLAWLKDAPPDDAPGHSSEWADIEDFHMA